MMHQMETLWALLKTICVFLILHLIWIQHIKEISPVQKLQILVLSVWIFQIISQTKFAAAKCQLKNLRGLKIIGLCGFRENEVCNVKCENNGTTIWRKQIRCLKKGRWSSTPSCQDLSVVKSLELIHCDKLPLNTREKAFCLKISQKVRRSKCPNLLNLRIRLNNCSRDPETDCKVSCGESYDTLRCLESGVWSHIPKCTSVKSKICPEPKVGTLVNCSRREGERCKIQCPGGRLMEEEILCLSSGIWSLASLSYKNKGTFSSRNVSKISIISKCSCPPLKTKNELITLEDCSQKKIGEKCELGCKNHFSIIGNQITVCLKNLSWSSLPECRDITCPLPQLTKSLIFRENCSSKYPRQRCKLGCNGSAEIIDNSPLTCINGTHWSKLPHCVCLPPVLPDNMTTAEDCQRKKLGRTCRLKCKRNFSVSGLNLITCLNNGSWTPIPSCEKVVCPQLHLPSYLLYNEDCSHKSNGEICNLICKLGGEFLNDGHVKCIKGKHWSHLPTCSCPKPYIREDLEMLEDCTFKRPGETCKIKCREELSSSGNDLIICQNDTSWTTQPSCKKTYCRDPILPAYLSVKQNCTAKSVGSVCQVFCKQNGNTVELNFITCLDTLEWSPFPTCTCGEPKLINNLLFKDDCKNTLPGNKCELQCTGLLKLIGNPFIRCLQNSTWSSLPTCSNSKCSKPLIPETLIFSEACLYNQPGDKCNLSCKEGGKILGNNFITCLNETHWSNTPTCTCPKPHLKSDLKLLTECDSVLPGQECYFICENNSGMNEKNTITCGNDTKWTDEPMCNKKYCKAPTLAPFLLFEDVCSSKMPGEKCMLSCKEGGEVIGNSTIKCLNMTHWSEMPDDCGCPLPLLDDDLISEDNCTHKRRGDICHVQCKGGKKLIGNSYIKCQNNFRWSSQPMCRIRFCTDPLPFKEILRQKEDCLSKTVGDTCVVECAEGGQIIGSSTIKCFNETHWSTLPDCTCSEPKLPENLKFEEDCSNKRRGNKCKISCRGFQKFIGNNNITCGENTKWSSFPRCEAIFCPKPHLTKGILISVESCTFKAPNERCELECEQGGKIIGEDFITCINGTKWSKLPDCMCPPPSLKNGLILKEDNCDSKNVQEKCELSCESNIKIDGEGSIICQNNTKWSPLPLCEEKFCPKPKLPSALKIENDCTSVTAGQFCELSCSEGGKIIGGNRITCLSNLTWSVPPVCTCPVPNWTDDLEFKNCSSVLPGQNCSISCKDRLFTLKNSFITCNNETKWSTQPVCKKVKCRNRQYRPNSTYEGNCTNISAGEKCLLRCKGGGNFVDNKNYIMCTYRGIWSRAKKCYCPPLIPPDGYILKENDCSKKLPENICRIACSNGADLKDQDYIKCDTFAKWVTFPQCELSLCPSPILSNGVITTESCDKKTIGGTCKLSCKNGGSLNGSDTLFCDTRRSWSSAPNCTCPNPSSSRIRALDNCEQKTIGQSCYVACNSNISTTIRREIKCMMESQMMWSAFPDCTCSFPTKLNPYITIGKECEDLKRFEIGQTCSVSCANSGVLFNENKLTCLDENIWSPSPICGCTLPPRFGLNLIACNLTLPGKRCQVSCDTGTISKNFMECNESYHWDQYPTCSKAVQDFCSAPAVKFPLLASNCLRVPIGESCEVSCANGGSIGGGRFWKCQEDLRYLVTGVQFPQCYCPLPNLGILYEFKMDCQHRAFGEHCLMACKYSRQEFNITCVMGPGNKKWSNPIVCAKPCNQRFVNMRKYLVDLAPPCQTKTLFLPGEVCEVICRTGGIYSSSPTTRCLSNGSWDVFPFCSCPPFPRDAGYGVPDDCDKKFVNETCIVSCIVPQLRIPGTARFMCNGTSWKNTPGSCDPLK